MKIKNGKPKFFLALGTAQLIFACIVFLHELYAINHSFPGGSFPIEHEYSWARVFLFCGMAIASLLAIWLFTTKNDLSILLPAIRYIPLFAVLITLGSLLLSYESKAGWCCGAAMASMRYFGFPFSFMRADSLVEVFLNFDVSQIVKYNFMTYQFFLNLLFWSNAVIIFLSWKSALFQTRVFHLRNRERGLSKNG